MELAAVAEQSIMILINLEVAMEVMEAEEPAVVAPESVLPELPEEMVVLAAQG